MADNLSSDFSKYIYLFAYYGVMEWSDQHDISLSTEMISQEIFSSKKGISSKGKTWESIQVLLMQIENPKLQIKEKLGVRNGWDIVQGANEGRRSSQCH